MSPSPVAIKTDFENTSGWLFNRSRAITVPIEYLINQYFQF
jgi:hypothetical protein